MFSSIPFITLPCLFVKSQLLLLILLLFCIFFYVISCLVFSFSVDFSRFRLLPSFSPLYFSFLVSLSLLFCFVFCLCFFFGFFHFLFFFLSSRSLGISILCWFSFSSFFFSPFSTPPCCFFSSFGFSCSSAPPPPTLSQLFPILLWSFFSSISLSPPLSSFGFHPTFAFLLLFPFSLLLSHPPFLLFVLSSFLCSSSFVVFCFVDSFFLRIFFLCRQFLPSLLSFLISSFPCLFLFLQSLFILLSFFPFGFPSLSLLLCFP